jgi:hypothetical protein
MRLTDQVAAPAFVYTSNGFDYINQTSTPPQYHQWLPQQAFRLGHIQLDIRSCVQILIVCLPIGSFTSAAASASAGALGSAWRQFHHHHRQQRGGQGLALVLFLRLPGS